MLATTVTSSATMNTSYLSVNRGSNQSNHRRIVAKVDTFSRNDQVYVKSNPKNKHKPWIFGDVENRGQRSCVVNTVRRWQQ